LHEENKPVSPPQPPAINRQLWLRFLTIAKPYWVSEHRWSLWAGLGLLLPTVIIANDVLSGRLEVGLAVQAAGAFAAMLIAINVFPRPQGTQISPLPTFTKLSTISF
jgi:ABC-type uncharacterized transport system fused permease/ATPase subunit